MYNRGMYDKFENIEIPYYYQDSFTQPEEEYMTGDVATYTLSQGDTTIIPFQIPCGYMDCDIKLTIVNFRGEEIYEEYLDVRQDGNVYFNINAELSDIFIRGTYKCRLQALKAINSAEYYDVVTTILDYDDCTFYVR